MGVQWGGGALLTWELDCRWGEEEVEKGKTGQVEETRAHTGKSKKKKRH